MSAGGAAGEAEEEECKDKKDDRPRCSVCEGDIGDDEEKRGLRMATTAMSQGMMEIWIRVKAVMKGSKAMAMKGRE